jgi:hypothetical protein
MNRRRLHAVALAAAAAAVVALGGIVTSGRAGAAASSGDAVVLIRHQLAHCHTWSVNGGHFAAAQKLTLERGATITVVNEDVMSHRLIELAGSPVEMRNGSIMPMGASMHGSAAPGLMNHMGATTAVELSKPGVYRFRTRAGEDYMAGITTTGADNVLTLVVTVR